MPIRDVTVTISRETQSVSQAGFGVPLILTGEQEQSYTTYMDLESVSIDFPEETEVHAIANRVFAQNPKPQKVAVLGVEYDSETDEPTTLTSALNDNAEEDFYFLLSTEQGEAEITALSEWVDAQKKMYVYTSDDPTIHENMESDRTVPALHNDPTSYFGEGWVGRCAPEDPGSITWKFKTVNGVPNGGFSASEVNDIADAGGNTYVRQGGVLHTYDGRVTSGEWIDVIRSQDFIESRIEEEVFRTLVNASKVPYTSAGIAMITSAVESVLQNASNNGMIAEDEDGQPLYSVTAPSRSDISDNDRANRILPDIKFEFTLAGAVHKAEIGGTIKV